MKRSEFRDPPLGTYHSNSPVMEGNEFRNKLRERRGGAVQDSKSILFTGVRARKRNPNLPTPIKEFIESNFSFCFANLEEGKFNRISKLSGWIAALSEEILKAEQGIRIFEWAMNRATEIAHHEKGDAMPQAIINIFEASSKVASLGKPADISEFFSACKGMPVLHLLTTTAAISTASSYTEFRDALSIAHSEVQQLKLSRKNSISNSGF